MFFKNVKIFLSYNYVLVNVSLLSKKVVSSAEFTNKNKIYNISLLQITYKHWFSQNAFTDFLLHSHELITTLWLQLNHDLTMLLQSNQLTLPRRFIVINSDIWSIFHHYKYYIKRNLFEHSTHVKNSIILQWCK